MTQRSDFRSINPMGNSEFHNFYLVFGIYGENNGRNKMTTCIGTTQGETYPVDTLGGIDI